MPVLLDGRAHAAQVERRLGEVQDVRAVNPAPAATHWARTFRQGMGLPAGVVSRAIGTGANATTKQ